MSEETASKMSDWIGQEHSMASVPPRVHRMAKDVFAIPQEFHFEIPPSSMLPITEIREFSVHPPELSRVANAKKNWGYALPGGALGGALVE
jgi:hypothetical protein